MSAVKLSIISCLLMLGMLMLPSLTGAGMGSMVTRLWLAFGILVFTGNYLAYQQEAAQQAAKDNQRTRQGEHPLRQEVRSLS
ncbi:MAG TPA: hypothetical protein VFC74_07050 [Oscillospiraceae bacterium]|nr:hypothetical protein [Oscillospiraceae bacterium]